MKAPRLLASGPQCQVVFLLLNFKIILLDHLPFSFKHATAKIMSFYNNIKKALSLYKPTSREHLALWFLFTAKYAPLHKLQIKAIIHYLELPWPCPSSNKADKQTHLTESVVSNNPQRSSRSSRLLHLSVLNSVHWGRGWNKS